MGGAAGPELAAAVASAGAVGLIGSGGEPFPSYLIDAWPTAEAAVSDAGRTNLGMGMNIRQLEDDPDPAATLAALLALKPGHVYLSFGDIAPHAPAVLASGARLYTNVGDVEAALHAARAGASVVVMQGSDGGGHTHHRASVFALVPEARSALDAAGYQNTLVAASGGVSDGRGLAAALMLGADAAVMGTRLAACSESEYTEQEKAALVATSDGARGTTFGRFHDALNGIHDHSSGLPGRCVVTRSTELEKEWPGPPTEGESAEAEEKRAAILRTNGEAVERVGGHGAEWGTVWAGAAVGLVTKVNPAAEVLDEVIREAEVSLRRGAALVTRDPADPTQAEMTPGSPEMLARAVRVKEAYADRVLSPQEAAALMAGDRGFDSRRVVSLDVRTPDQLKSHEINGRAGVTLADESGDAVMCMSLDDLVVG